MESVQRDTLMSRRELNLRKEKISNARYRELKAFCEQYGEWKERLISMQAISSVQYSDMPGNPNKGVSDMTGRQAIDRIELEEKCKLIEDVAVLAGDDLAKFIIANVCDNKSVISLKQKGLRIERSGFYYKRRKFFCILDKMKN